MTAIDNRVRLAMIGCGAAAHACHLPAFAAVQAGDLSAIIDTSSERRSAFAETYRSEPERPTPQSFGSIDEALGSFDAAVVATPHTLHADIALQLLAAGKHVLMEKPIAHDLAAAALTVEAVGDHPDLIFAMAHPRRLFPAYAWIKELLLSGELGDVTSVRWVEGGPYGWEPYSGTMFDRALSGGGVLIDSASHIFDTLAWWLGTDLEVVAYADNARGGVESDAIATLASGQTAITVEVSRLRNIGTACTITGSKGSATIGTDFPAGLCRHLAADGAQLFYGDVVAATPPARNTWEGIFEEQLEDFCRAVLGDVSHPLSSIEEGITALRLVSACYDHPDRRPLSMPWLSAT